MSARGFGGIVRSPAQPPPGAPATVTGANNGLDLDAANVVLGQDMGEPGDPAQLLSDREIPMNFARFRMINGANTFLDLDSLGEIAILGASNSNLLRLSSGINETAEIFFGVGTRALNFDFNNGQYVIGDVDNATNGTFINVDDANEVFIAQSAGGKLLELDRTNQLYRLGDIDGFGNGATLEIQDVNSSLLFFDSAFSSQSMNLSPIAGTYGIGDLNSIGGGNYLLINDSTNEFRLGGASSRIDIIADVAQITANGVLVLNLDAPAANFAMGDISGANNGTVLEVDDAANSINITNTLGTSFVTINGVAGFTGTVTPVTSITVDGGIVTAVT